MLLRTLEGIIAALGSKLISASKVPAIIINGTSLVSENSLVSPAVGPAI
jgi:hypothetical protein